jgi:two-component system, chemotaxis family, response regulator Rcp1
MRNRAIRLLVVEDNAAYLHLIREAFTTRNGSHKWDLSVATDGEEAIWLLRGGKPGSFVPDIVLLDWNLPKVSGLEVLKWAKAHEELRKIPILVFSTSDADRDVHEAYRHHANGYITKPSDMDVLYKVAEAIENFWVAIAELTSFKRDKPAGIRPLAAT